VMERTHGRKKSELQPDGDGIHCSKWA